MNKPRPNTLLDRDTYWEQVDSHKPARFDWCFDFISIHSDCQEHHGPYSLLAPLCLVDSHTGTRPDWERTKYPTKTAAVAKARQLAKHHRVFILDCH